MKRDEDGRLTQRLGKATRAAAEAKEAGAEGSGSLPGAEAKRAIASGDQDHRQAERQESSHEAFS
jgi:hypothetical protein